MKKKITEAIAQLEAVADALESGELERDTLTPEERDKLDRLGGFLVWGKKGLGAGPLTLRSLSGEERRIINKRRRAQGRSLEDNARVLAQADKVGDDGDLYTEDCLKELAEKERAEITPELIDRLGTAALESLTLEERELMDEARRKLSENPMYTLEEDGHVRLSSTGERVLTAEAKIAVLEHQLAEMRGVQDALRAAGLVPDKHATLAAIDNINAKLVDGLRPAGRPRQKGVSKRINVSIEEGLLDQVDRLVAQQGWTRSSAIARGLRRLLTHFGSPAGTATGQRPEN